MGWLTSLPAGVIVDESTYARTRINPEDSSEIQYRAYKIRTIEYRGMTYAAAKDALDNDVDVKLTIYSNGARTATMKAIGGGGYTITVRIDWATGAWATGSGSP